MDYFLKILFYIRGKFYSPLLIAYYPLILHFINQLIAEAEKRK